MANSLFERSCQHDGASGFPMISKFETFLKKLEIFEIFKIIFKLFFEIIFVFSFEL